MIQLLLNTSSITLFVHAGLLVALAVRVIMKRPATGVALAWILLIAVAPLVGATLYLLIGERRIGSRRTRRLDSLRTDFANVAAAAIRERLTDVDWSRHPQLVQSLNGIGHHLLGSPTVCGSSYQLFADTHEILASLARDVDAARDSILMEFYIWHPGGVADEVLEAVIRAAGRGVYCCVLIDALGARPWWKTDQPRRLRAAGVQLRPALPVGLLRTFVGRTDLRLHRKIVVIDSQIAWTGSMNLVDPRYFKQSSGVGQWVDAMMRLQGSVVVPLAATMIGDWMLESGQSLEQLIADAKLQLVQPCGPMDCQVIPSGPGESGDAQLQMILAMIQGARDEVVMTTPYLVPDESLLRTIRGASARGVTVRLVVPEHVDSLMTRYASRSYFDDLLGSRIEVYLYGQGLLHTKSITADGEVAMFGTVNLDMRSFWLNYEVALYVYDRDCTAAVRKLQQAYLLDSKRLDAAQWAQRGVTSRFLENTFRLASPLL